MVFYLHFFDLRGTLLLHALNQHVHEREHLEHELFVDANIDFAHQYGEVLDIGQVRI